MRLAAVLPGMLALALAAGAGAEARRPLLALCYHDVVQTPAEAQGDPMAVTVDDLVGQLGWLQAQGYQPIDLATWTAAAEGGALPARPVLLTFDDGYASFHEHVLPLLELFELPAVLAPVTSWIDAPANQAVPYGDTERPRSDFMTWEQIRAATDTGLVTLASHSHDLHRGVTGNPFGNLQPAAVTRRFDRATGSYESEAAYRARLRDDLERSVALLERRAGVRPRAVAWPYGAYNATASAVARGLGLDHSLTLDPTPNSPAQHNVHRRLVGADMDLAAFAMMVGRHYAPEPLRAAHVDLDYVYDADPAQQARNLDRLLDRIKAMAINAVFLQAFADPDGDGVADALYFRNRHLPMRADLFNRVAWQLRTRASVKVFAWMPVLAFELPDQEANRRLAVQAADGSHRRRYHRLSPYHPEARRLISEIYDDLGRSSHFTGVLFHDDALLDEQEDANPAAPRRATARAKTDHLIAFTGMLADVLRRHHPALETARNLYARTVLEPASERWFAQSFERALASYDYTAVMAMPYLEDADAPARWLERLVDRVSRVPGGLERTVFEVQTRDWRGGAPLAPQVLARHLEILLDSGARHIAWYPDDFIAGQPPVALIRASVSLADHPAVAE